MRFGKVSDNILKRSVLKQIRTKRDEIRKGAAIGEDCAFFSFEKGTFTCNTQSSVVFTGEDLHRLMERGVNNLAASGMEAVGVQVALTLPENTEEPVLKSLMQSLEKSANECHVQISGGHTTVSPYVKETQASMTCVGKPMEGVDALQAKCKPGEDIVVTKWIGLEGTALLAAKHGEELKTRYPSHLIEEAQSFLKYLSVVPEAAVAWKSGAESMHDVSEGGIFAALWEMAEQAGVGLVIDLRKLPIRQETVEVCEFLNRNPYELMGGGSMIITAKDGEKLVSDLEAAGIPAVIVGRTTDHHDKLILNEEEKRYMDRPAIDQIYE